MRISDALKIIQAGGAGPEYPVLVACGFTPLHFKTFFHAYLQRSLLERQVRIQGGLYGDLAGTLENADEALQGVVVALEWSDLDPRLGYRSAGRWTRSTVNDVVKTAEAVLARLGKALEHLSAGVRVVVSLPTLPLPPLFHTPGGQASEAEIRLDQLLQQFAGLVAMRKSGVVVNARRLAEESPLAERYDFKSDLLTGFPYTQSHTDALASACSRLLAPAAPKKGLITDLDDTMWSGIVGEVGPEGVSWGFNEHQHMHALYQNLLSSLAEQGVLIAVASKNELATVEQTFSRPDMLLKAEQVFPMEVHWQAKSGSVERILQTWNIAADSVIFVDDSPMEVAEVETAHPGITGLRFPKGDYAAFWGLLRQIRDLCGKEQVSEEDRFRLASIRQGEEFRKQADGGSVSDQFLEMAESAVVLDFAPAAEDARVLELVNKTNQFNLNGLRRSDADWAGANRQPGAVVAAISYEDKFGPLGKIAVLQGQQQGRVLALNTWVMSCRAFSRRVEHQCLRILFDRLGVDEIHFAFTGTAKNGPVRQLLESLTGAAENGSVVLTRQQFEARCPKLFHRVTAK